MAEFFPQEVGVHEDCCQRLFNSWATLDSREPMAASFSLWYSISVAVDIELRALPFHHPSELDTDLHPNIEQHDMRLLHLGSVEFHDAHDFSAYQMGQAKTLCSPLSLCTRCTAKRWVRGHIFMPLWLTGSDDASNDALVLFQYVYLRSLLERREALWRVEVQMVLHIH